MIDPVLLETILKEMRTHQAIPLLLTESGSRVYGYAHTDSDVDLLGVHLCEASSFLSFLPSRPPKMFIGYREDGPPIVDVKSTDLNVLIWKISQGNGSLLEPLLSPHTQDVGGCFQILKRIGSSLLSKRMENHYRGYAKGWLSYPDQTSLLIKKGTYSVKDMVSVSHALLMGAHLLLTKELEVSLPVLHAEYKVVPWVSDLIAQRLEDRLSVVREDLDLNPLFVHLRNASERSDLPDRIDSEELKKLDGWLIRWRINQSRV